MARRPGISGFALSSILAGAVLVYAGIRGINLGSALQAVVQGKSPATVKPTQQIPGLAVGEQDSGSSSATSTPASTTTSSIANDALRYQGHPYIYGGAPGTSGQHGWDCSSFVNWVLGHDLGFTLPGESRPGYAGTSHGPNTVSYLGWTGAEHVAGGAAAAEAGDLCVWQTHMGIALGGGQMISALDEAEGTKQTSIAGGAPGGELLFVRRIVIGNPHA